MIPAAAPLGDVDTPRPLRAASGFIRIQGWCMIPGEPTAPAVRLVAENFSLPLSGRHRRDDVPRQFPTESAAAESGFTIEGLLPAGIHLARLEAHLPDGSWQPFRTLCIAAEARTLAVGIDSPAAGRPVTQRVHVEGWALHPDLAVESLTLRYGHQEIPCATGRPRTDVTAAYPNSLQAAHAGFKSRTILSAGRGPLRVKAQLADGSMAVARTALAIDVAKDENHDPELNLGAARVVLPVAPRPPEAEPVTPATRPLNILFVLYGSFDSNSALHVAALANELSRAGHAGIVAVPRDLSSLAHLHAPRFTAVLHTDAASSLVFPDGRGPDLIHAWTTRENVRLLTQQLQRRTGAKVIVHLEDNEQEILALALRRPWAELSALSTAELDRLVPADLSHPHRSREFLAAADGITVIAEPLRAFVPAGRPVHLLWPAADARYFGSIPQPEAFRRLVKRRPDESLLFYHGNVHTANAAEVRELYAAVLQLNEAGVPVSLVRTGVDTVDFLGDLAPRVSPFVIALGQILHHRHLPPLMALADIFVQPGRDDAFNRYRFPSKLPEFFALGRPVVLPRTNLGCQLRHGTDAYVLEHADASGIADAITAIRQDPALSRTLAAGAVAFSNRHFSWHRSAEALAKFYAELAG